MKKRFAILTVTALSLSLSFMGCKNDSAGSEKPAEIEQKASYIIGQNFGKQFTSQGLTVSLKDFVDGMKDGINNKDPRFTEEEIEQIMQEFQTFMVEKSEKRAEEMAQKGTEFLEKNKTKKDVVTLPSGLQYKVITEGTGEIPGPDDVVKTHYKGTLVDGTEFDSSYKRDQPAVFPVNGVIKGWVEALQLMKVGSKWELYIPSELGYGERGSGSAIPPNSVLIFEIELLEIQKS